MIGSFGAFRRWLGLFALLLLALGCRESRESVSPSVYLLNHEQWTPTLVLNFAQEVAPLDAVGKPPEPTPQLDPPTQGQWRWQDSSRLIFLPKDKTFQPGTPLKIALKEVHLRDGYRLANPSLSYQTPPLSIVRQECRFRDIPEAPIRRRLEAVVEFNYPVDNPSFMASIGENLPLPLYASGKSRITILSDPIARPDRDGNLNFNVNPGPIQLRDLNNAGATSNLAKSAGCQLPILRSAWDKLEEQAPKPSKVTDIDVGLNNGKLNVRLQGRDLKESAKKASVGQEVKNGVTMSPAVAGIWNYGESASGADLIFTPVHSEDLKPGTGYEISVATAAFPQLVFDKPKISKTFKAQPMTGSIGNVRLYSDPIDPRVKRITATLNFSFPPQKDGLAAKTSVRLRLEPAKSFDDKRVQSIAFELAYDDKNPNLAYLKTAPITIPEEPGEVRVIVEKGLVSSLGGEPTLDGAERNFPIPGARDYLKFTEATSESAVKDNGDIERLLILHTSLALKDASSLPQSVEAYLLPDCGETARPAPCEEKSIEQWQTAEQVDADVLKSSSRIPLVWRESSEGDKTLHYLSFSASEKRQLLIKVNKGVESADGFKLAEDARYLVGLGENQKELKILHDGALLSLTGSKKLGVAVRGLDKVHVELQRVLPHNMHHLAQFTRGEFQNPEFKLPIEHFAEKLSYDETLPAGKEMERRYFAVDFARFVRDKGYPPRGLFLLKVAEKKPPATACPSDESANTADQENAETGEADQEAPTG
ncbi:MAG: hypothetical protein PHE55_20620, partial [Methylococcaceae bacterium]|nr:hypothetical protein [Methylococcaceae bacterium]